MNALRQNLLAISQWCALVTLFCVPLWLRLPYTPLGVTPYYVTRFVIVLPLCATIITWLAAGAPGLIGGERRRGRAAWSLLLMLLASWAFASLWWAFMRDLEPDVGENAALQFGLVALFAVAVAHLGVAPRRVIGVLALSLCVTAAITIAQAARQGWLELEVLGEFIVIRGMRGIGIIQAGASAYIRPYGLMPHPNMGAGVLLICTLCASTGIIHARRWVRWGAVLLIACGVLAILLTFSRAAWGGLAIGVIVLFPFVIRRLAREPEKRTPVLVAAALVIIIGVGFTVRFAPFLAARAGQTEESIEMRSVADRLVYSAFALRSIQERPVLGVGAGNFPWRTSYYLVDTFYDLRGDNVHNIYLSAWAELGAVGLGLYIAALGTGLYAIIHAIRHGDAAQRAARMGILAAVIALLAVGWLDHYPYTILHFQTALWGLIGVGIGGDVTARPRAHTDVMDKSRA